MEACFVHGGGRVRPPCRTAKIVDIALFASFHMTWIIYKKGGCHLCSFREDERYGAFIAKEICWAMSSGRMGWIETTVDRADGAEGQ
jgi:hypothetical protein